MMIDIIIGIDDTDNLDSKGTGSIAEEMCEIIQSKGYGNTTFITRHQHFIHPDVPYTSHNSSMIFTATVAKEKFEELKRYLSDYLENEAAEGSDPGICIGEISKLKNLTNLSEFYQFGRNSKVKLLTKDEAYDLAQRCNLFLEERGGTGVGVIGAVAGTALRLEGIDGEVKGGIDKFEKGEIVKVSTLLEQSLIHRVVDENMNDLSLDDEIEVKWKVKPVINEGIPVLVVCKNKKNKWITLKKDEMRLFGDKRMNNICDLFEPDVKEELIGDFSGCYNCRYRRWTKESFTCMKDMKKN